MIGSWYERWLLGITGISVFLQLYVMFLIQWKSTKSMREYRWFLQTFTFWDMTFTLVLGLGLQSYPIVPLLGGSTRGLAGYFGDFPARIAEAGALYTGSQVIISQDYALIYRCILIRANREVHDVYVSWPSRVFWFVVHQAIAMPIGYGFYCTFLPTEFVSGRLAENHVPSANTPAGFPVIIIDFASPFTWRFFFALVFLMIFSEVLCLVLIVLILSSLKRATFSKHSLKLQYELCCHLIVLLIVPLLLIIVPCTLCVVALFCDVYSTEIAMQVGLTILTLYGPVNAVVTILLIQPFRSFTFRPFKPWLHSRSFFPTQLPKTSALPASTPLGFQNAATSQSAAHLPAGGLFVVGRAN